MRRLIFGVWTPMSFQKEIPKGAVVAAIGPAGERRVRYASIMNDGKDGRAAGRGGTGAVMGK